MIALKEVWLESQNSATLAKNLKILLEILAAA